MSDVKYTLIELKDIDLVDFSKTQQRYFGNLNNLRLTKDGKSFVISYIGDQPEFVFDKITKDAVGLIEYTADEILIVLNERS